MHILSSFLPSLFLSLSPYPIKSKKLLVNTKLLNEKVNSLINFQMARNCEAYRGFEPAIGIQELNKGSVKHFIISICESIHPTFVKCMLGWNCSVYIKYTDIQAVIRIVSQLHFLNRIVKHCAIFIHCHNITV